MKNKSTAMKPVVFVFLLLMTLFGQAQTLPSSNLPIVIVNTEGGAVIRDEPKTMANMKIINNGPGKRNLPTDTPNDYVGKIGIETRGSTSQQLFPKKPYGFETWDDKGVGKDAKVLGFPTEQDWILFASYNEKSLMHNVVSMKLYRDMGLYASRTQHVELILNDRYEGVYVLMEKVKRAEGRVAISKLAETENTGDALTGGYIFKVDKNTGSGGNLSWTSALPPMNNSRGQKTIYYYDYPKPSLITTTQRNYLKMYVDSAETVLNSANFADKTNGFRRFFDSQSFAKFFIINEITRNVDGYRISTYFHKDKNSKDRRIKAGPAWDFDLALGNADYCEGWRTSGWAYLFGSVCPDDYYQVPFHWRRMLQDPAFAAEVGNVYHTLRKSTWKTDKIHAYIDSVANVVEEGQARNFQRWPVIGQYLWPNPRPVPTSWRAEINELKQWLSDRLLWLDQNMPTADGGANVLAINNNDIHSAGLSVKVLGNPVGESLSLLLETEREMEVVCDIIDPQGRVVTDNPVRWLNVGKNIVTVPMSKHTSGAYVVRVHTSTGVIRQKIMKK